MPESHFACLFVGDQQTEQNIKENISSVIFVMSGGAVLEHSSMTPPFVFNRSIETKAISVSSR